ncbi:uncharacterized protein LOC144663874 isoform X2 [Oculina patagonica]
MCHWFKVLFVVFIGLGVIHIRVCSANGNSSTPGNEDEDEEDEHDKEEKELTIAWIEKPPYVTSPPNGSLDNDAHGIIRDTLLRYLTIECGYYARVNYDVKTLRMDNEFGMIELLRQNKVHVALPIFEPINRKYSEFPFFKLADYPGTEFITTDDETNGLSVVLDAVLKSWPLFAVTLILTAIAGVIVWALDTYWNSEEFPRSFIKGSWDGFWWSFISMTTVGYGDKAPKSIVARIFSIIWILLGLIIMAIFMANVTSALTSLSLQLEPSSFAGLKVAVLGNGTEYQHAQEEDAQPKVYHKIDDVIQAVKSKQVDGMFLDRYTASYYQTRDKLKSLLTVNKLELQRDVGVLFSKDREDLAECLLNYHFSSIWKSVQTITSTFKLTQQKPSTNVNLFDESSSFVKEFMYISLGVLAGMLLVGILWDILIRKRRKTKQNIVEGAVVNEGMTADTFQNDLEVARQLLRQTQEQFNKLELKVSRLKYYQ